LPGEGLEAQTVAGACRGASLVDRRVFLATFSGFKLTVHPVFLSGVGLNQCR